MIEFRNMNIKREELFNVLKNKDFFKLSSLKCNEQLVQYIVDKIGVGELSEQYTKEIKCIVKVFVTKLFAKWRECNYIYNRFTNKNMKWLNGNVKFPEMQPYQCISTPRGRPRKIFEESSQRSKQRQVQPMVSKHSPEELCLAAETSLVKSGKRTAAQVMKLAIETTPKGLKKMKVENDAPSATVRPYNPEEALGLIVDLGLTREDYTTMRLGAKERGADIYPSYHLIAEAKKKCYPANIKVTENEAEVPLLDLLIHTSQRLAQVQADVILQNMSENCNTIEVYYKWGLDGSGGHSIYKQNFASNLEYADSNIILCTIVPLQMSQFNGNNQKIYWKNSTPSSTRYCRPIGFKIQKENAQNVK